MTIKTFRGNLKSYAGTASPSDGQDRIRLSTKQGKIGYRIVKLDLIPQNFGTADVEGVLQVYKVEQTTPTNVVDFSDTNLLAVGLWSMNSNVTTEVSGFHVMFEQEIFNQDIYVTFKDTQSSTINYYLELEVMNLSDNEASVSTLMDIRGS